MWLKTLEARQMHHPALIPHINPHTFFFGQSMQPIVIKVSSVLSIFALSFTISQTAVDDMRTLKKESDESLSFSFF